MPQSDDEAPVNWDAFDLLCLSKGWTTDAERARKLRVSHSHITNLRAGRGGAGGKFIKQCLAAFGAASYDVLFKQPAEAEPAGAQR